jgi:hypothetical protein
MSPSGDFTSNGIERDMHERTTSDVRPNSYSSSVAMTSLFSDHQRTNSLAHSENMNNQYGGQSGLRDSSGEVAENSREPSAAEVEIPLPEPERRRKAEPGKPTKCFQSVVEDVIESISKDKTVYEDCREELRDESVDPRKTDSSKDREEEYFSR